MPRDTDPTPRYAEFFAGGGMVRAALDDSWDCAFANDIDAMKCTVYGENWGTDGLIFGDVANLDGSILRQPIDLYWASSPCQDFSLAGNGNGLGGLRSGVFLTWVQKIQSAISQGHAPALIAFENVMGLVTRNGGRDFTAVITALAELGYHVGGLEIDARDFVPQSRPRLFVVCVRADLDVDDLSASGPAGPYHTRRITEFVSRAPVNIRKLWRWWRHDAPAMPPQGIAAIIDTCPDTPWFDAQTRRNLTAMMSPPSLSRLQVAKASGGMQIGTLYRRGRPGPDGVVRQRAEVRFDGVAGCLRTPAGGSSRQTLLLVEGGKLRARLLSTREAARLMGLPDSYHMPGNYNAAYKVAGDGVVVPVVQYLDRTLFRRVLARQHARAAL
ncbi:DNA (cytosine-5)-methyltransferase 1 [Jannaschia faecimaris]|uniref:DNA (cytosine-5-)-methyltransferase n=1 Tax=Jannaschia faecimaris TaxID=1244108 RepID=A0A1H3SMI1_9RHOB|nr:DNA cytosine methyltransferase [Jannaschia faecimaris]SDZ38775.1 DNA (cytosine-5)-methyltransferase 1 [Jannaschia faecimaris]